MTNRAQLGATVPFYRASYLGTAASGLDDVYINGKFAVIDPSSNGRFGLAVGSVIEILSAGTQDMSRVQWAVPVSMEVRGSGVRGYGSAGYFSRGAEFTAGAVEWTPAAGTSLTGALGTFDFGYGGCARVRRGESHRCDVLRRAPGGERGVGLWRCGRPLRARAGRSCSPAELRSDFRVR